MLRAETFPRAASVLGLDLSPKNRENGAGVAVAAVAGHSARRRKAAARMVDCERDSGK